MTNADQIAVTFFDEYAQALLDRDADRLSPLYAVPALIAFPQQAIAVSDPDQTRQFFDRGWEQYAGVDQAEPAVTVIAATPHSIWADVVWFYGGQPRERFIYQLLRNPQPNGADRWQVGVLTPPGQDD